VFLGASSPAIWTMAQRLVEARIATAEATHDAKLEHLNAALKADENAVLTSVNTSLTSTISAAAAELRAARDIGATGPTGPATPGAPAADMSAVAPVVDAGTVIGDIEEVVGEAAAATPGEVDVQALSLALFEKLPATVAGLTGPPAAVPGAPAAPAGPPEVLVEAEAAEAAEPADTVALEAAPVGAPVAPAGGTPVDRALQILEDGIASA
jgi:hypothetical protein